MKRVILSIILCWGCVCILFSQTIIAKQSFETSGDTWTPLNFSTPPCTSGNDIWDYATNIRGLTANDGSQFWGIRDLDGNCGGNGFETISFPNVNVSSFQNVIFSFDYYAFSFDNNDDLKYELFYDGVSQGEVVLIDGVNNNSDNTNGWVTEDVNIPSSVTNVGLILSARNNNGSDIGGFDNVVLLSSSVTNGGCSNAETLTIGSSASENIVTGTNVGATTSGELPNPNCGNYNGRDVWYTAQVPQSGNITVETLSSVIDPVIAVYTGTCGNLTLIDCNDDVDYPNSLESRLVLTGLSNTTIYIRVFAYNNASSGNFNIVAYAPPTVPNDTCFIAQNLTVGSSNTENVVTSTNVGATDSGVSLNPNCDQYLGGDVWFTAQVPASGILNIETLNAGGITDTGLAIYTGTCDSLTQIACDADSGSNFFSLVTLTGLPNTQVYIRVWEYQNNSFGEFNIVAYSPECPLTTTWNGSSWSNGAPNEFTSAIINGNYTTSSNGDFDSCNCTISSTATVTVSANNYILIDNDLTVNGTIDVQHEGSLVMVQNDGNVSGSGTVNIFKTSTSFNQYDYMYWSSPTNNETIGSALSNSESENIYQYNPSSGWSPVSGGTTMASGKGYIAMGDISGSFPKTQSVLFNGTINNGIISTPVSTNGGAYGWNLVGNPYPSAISATALLSDVRNSSRVFGSIYLWTHNTEISENTPGNEKYNYSSNDYATFTAGSGGVAAISGGPIPNGFIASGQGFFVETYSSGNLTFDNYMRVTNNNNQLFRDNNEKKNIEKDRIWLELKNDKGAFSQILIGYFPKATNGVDRNYDGERFAGNKFVSFYSLIDTQYFAIQGKTPFDTEDTVKLGYTTTIDKGEKLKIGINTIEGELLNYNIYLKDNLLGITHDLQISDYEFTIESKGIFNERFELYLTKNEAVLSASTEQSNKDDLIIRDLNNELEVRTSNGTFINNFKAYDILGKMIIDHNPENNQFKTSINNLTSGTILIINATLENNQKIIKKVWLR